MATPLIRIPQEQGGTMYAFSNAARDLTRAYYNPDVVFEYSKFALLDIPVVGEPGVNSTNNYIQFDNLYKGGVSTGTGADPSINDNYDSTDPDDNANRHFAQSFQNYALNLENFILSDDDFDETIYASDAEKIFFKWLNHLGAFRTKPATSQDAVDNSALVEEDDSIQTGTEYSKVVKYLGSIDVSNDKNYNGDTYNEVFINVPSSVGYTPTVLFKSTDYNTNDTSYLTETSINGRDGQSHPDANIDLRSIADSSDGTINIDPNSTYNYGIDWDESRYAKIVSDKKLNNLLDYSKRGGDFRFNAIAVYYDVYSKSNPLNKSTNLYGIVLLDNWKYDPGNTGWYIPELSKYKPNEVTGLNGNAFALKLNVKFNSSLDNVGIEKNINDYSTFSMDIFFDSTSSLENAAKILADATSSHNKLNERLDALEGLFLTTVDTDNLSDKVSALENSLEIAALNYENAGSVLDMISSTNKRLNQMINGEIPTELQYNTDVIKAGIGISVDRSSIGKIKLHNSNYGYVLNDVYEYNYSNKTVLNKIDSSNKLNPVNFTTRGIWSRIKGYDNLIRIYLEEEVFSSNLNIYLDDSSTSFKLGQVIKLVFRTPIANLDNKAINIYTDKRNGWILKKTISTSDLLSKKPYVELICVDEINKTFELDIIR
jgi:hypothetical protein